MPATPDDAALVAALRALGPQGRMPGSVLFATAAMQAAGIDVDRAEAWARAQGGGPVQAGAVKLRKGQRPQDGTVGRPEAFLLVPESALG